MNTTESPGTEALIWCPVATLFGKRGTIHYSFYSMSGFQYDEYLGSFEHPSRFNDIGSPEQIAFYSCFINGANDYRFNDHSALRRYKGGELHLPLSLESAADREEFRVASVRLEQVPRPSLAPVIAACVGPKASDSVRSADVVTRRGALSSLGTGEEMTFTVMYVNGKLHIDKKKFVPTPEVLHDGPYFGHCFEEVCTASETSEPNGRFCSIVSRRLGDLSIVMAGEVDCAEGGYPSLEHYRELKTQKSRQHKNWPKWYLQSYLLGVPTLILGNRSKNNLLTSIQTMSMEALLAKTVTHSPGFDPTPELLTGILGVLPVNFTFILKAAHSFAQWYLTTKQRRNSFGLGASFE
ncbi:hypothetical protein BDM02DRAFT_3184692 [Thelephora ganbajun]|uniref:Uncharacterized protein n=1 Tax=Thelephora ganbajun TaxID=370292 RepID=A0ACB6ZNN6_THEGA|nr:hypothetical protein BDM02DRAFT_3184692 [Thelephora ganbajun]